MRWLAGPGLIAVVAVVVLAGCAGQGRSPAGPLAAGLTTSPAVTSAASSVTPGASPAASVPSAVATTPAAVPVGATGAGKRPQTEAMPRTGDAAFRALTTDLWLSVTTGNPGYGRPAFFPEAAYQQVKAIDDPEYDWQSRLWYDFTIDVVAAHQVVGSGARLDRVVVPVQYALWVPVGACHNNIGYWHVPGARVEYRKDGRLESIGIASMISWRGVWYIIHFGGVKRDGAGMVDRPSSGEGTPGPPGGC